jgi:trigger factor
MQTSCEKISDSEVKLSVEVTEEELNPLIERLTDHFVRTAKIPGFRPGRVPKSIILKKIGIDEIRNEAINDSLPGFLQQAVNKESLKYLATKELNVLSGMKEGPLRFDATVEVVPDVQIEGYKDVIVESESPEVTNKDLTRAIQSVTAPWGRVEKVDREIRTGDFVTLDIYECEPGGEFKLVEQSYLYEVGTNELWDDKLIGSKVNDRVQFHYDADSTESEDRESEDRESEYRESEDRESEGKRAIGAVCLEIKAVSEIVYPEISDEWLQENLKFESKAQFEEELRQRIAVEKKSLLYNNFKNNAVKALIDKVKVKIPTSLLQDSAEPYVKDLEKELKKRKIKTSEFLSSPDAEITLSQINNLAADRAKLDLALSAIISAENLSLDQELLETLETSEVSNKSGFTEYFLSLRALNWYLDNVKIKLPDGSLTDSKTLFGTGKINDTEEKKESDDGI